MATETHTTETKSTWECKKHSILAHDIFINYRVKSESQVARELFKDLSSRDRSDGKDVSVFLDQFCLNESESWEMGFLNGLRTAHLLVLLISEPGIEGITNADKWQDNVLLEYEAALEKHEAKTALVLPILVSKKKVVMDGDVKREAIAPFNGFGMKFPDAPHKVKHGEGKNVKQTMEKLFQIQGTRCDEQFDESVVQVILKKLDQILKELNLLSIVVSEKPVKTWNLEDVDHWLVHSGLEKYRAVFKEKAIEGPELLTLTGEDLKSLGIEDPFHVKKILRFITSKKESEVPTSPTTTETPTSPASSTSPTSPTSPTGESHPEHHPEHHNPALEVLGAVGSVPLKLLSGTVGGLGSGLSGIGTGLGSLGSRMSGGKN